VLGTELLDEAGDAAHDEVVAEVHDEVVVAEELARDEHRVRQAERLVLGDVRDVDPELRAVTDGFPDLFGGVTDDDPDIRDPGVGDGSRP